MQFITQQQYKTVIKNQQTLEKKVDALKEKVDRQDLLREFDEVTRWGRAFAKKKGIKPRDVLEDD